MPDPQTIELPRQLGVAPARIVSLMFGAMVLLAGLLPALPADPKARA